MADRGVLFSGPMVVALLEGRRTQTRRLAWRGDGNEIAPGSMCFSWLFRPIEGYRDYLAGRNGFIYTTKGEVPRPLKGSPSSRGYLTVSLCGDDGIKTHAVHTLIATAWLGPPPMPGAQVRHLDANKIHNRLENLDWGTAEDNWSDRRAMGHGVHEQHHAARLTMEKAVVIRSSSLPQRRLAGIYGVSQSVISDIKRERIWMPATPATGRNVALSPPTRLWVREAWATLKAADSVNPAKLWETSPLIYFADGATANIRDGLVPTWGRLRASMHMPRWASRITLTVQQVRVQRLQEINLRDAMAEGCEIRQIDLFGADSQEFRDNIGRGYYRDLWDSLNRDRAPWDSNPWIVAYTFSVARKNIDA